MAEDGARAPAGREAEPAAGPPSRRSGPAGLPETGARRGRARLGLALVAAVAAVVAVPLALALTDAHLAPGPPALVVSTAAGALAASALALQPLLAARARGSAAGLARRRLRRHQVLGLTALVLVLVHVGGLFAVEVDDTLFAFSPDGPTRARMAVIATLALAGVVALGLARGRVGLADGTWRALHAYLAVLAIALGIGHALLTDGALDGLGTPVLVGLGALGLLGVPAAHLARRRPSRGASPRG